MSAVKKLSFEIKPTKFAYMPFMPTTTDGRMHVTYVGDLRDLCMYVYTLGRT